MRTDLPLLSLYTSLSPFPLRPPASTKRTVARPNEPLDPSSFDLPAPRDLAFALSRPAGSSLTSPQRRLRRT
jgi:hypothetical protein